MGNAPESCRRRVEVDIESCDLAIACDDEVHAKSVRSGLSFWLLRYREEGVPALRRIYECGLQPNSDLKAKMNAEADP